MYIGNGSLEMEFVDEFGFKNYLCNKAICKGIVESCPIDDPSKEKTKKSKPMK
jgi:hypothetical protein